MGISTKRREPRIRLCESMEFLRRLKGGSERSCWVGSFLIFHIDREKIDDRTASFRLYD